jgi:hypothetical protein
MKMIMLAFLGLAVATSIGLALNANESTRKLRIAQTLACEKANELRVESNNRIESTLALKKVVLRFLDEAIDGSPNTLTREEYTSLKKEIVKNVKYHETPEIDCAKEAVPK